MILNGGRCTALVTIEIFITPTIARARCGRGIVTRVKATYIKAIGIRTAVAIYIYCTIIDIRLLKFIQTITEAITTIATVLCTASRY